MKENEFKKGDMILLVEGRQNGSGYEGDIMEVLSNNRDYYQAKIVSGDKGHLGHTINIYKGTGGYLKDTVIFADRKTRAEYNRKKITDLKKQVADLEKETENLEKFATDEDEVADKLFKIGNAKGPKDIAKILKELKSSHYL